MHISSDTNLSMKGSYWADIIDQPIYWPGSKHTNTNTKKKYSILIGELRKSMRASHKKKKN